MSTQVIQSQVRFGTVKFFLKVQGYGFIIPDITGRDIYFRPESGRGVVAGPNGPELTFASLKAPWSQDRVVYAISNDNPANVAWWTYERDYRLVNRAVMLYPVVRVMQQHGFNGEAVPRRPHVVVGETKLPQLLQWLRNGTVVFLPHQVEGNRTTTQWVETKDGNEWRKDIPHLMLSAYARHQKQLAA